MNVILSPALLLSLADHLAQGLKVDNKKVLLLLNSFSLHPSQNNESSETSATSVTSTKSASSAASIKSANDDHMDTESTASETSKASGNQSGKCEHEIKKKDGSQVTCGKNTKSQVGDKWYCSVHIKGKANKIDHMSVTSVASSSKLTASTGVKKTKSEIPVVDPKKVADIKAKTLMKKINKQEILDVKKVGEHHIYIPNRIAFKRLEDGTTIAYGRLGTDGHTLLPLDDTALQWLDAHNLKYQVEETIVLRDKKDEVDSDDEADAVELDVDDSEGESEDSDIELDLSDDE